jgi:hypothetical protein
LYSRAIPDHLNGIVCAVYFFEVDMTDARIEWLRSDTMTIRQTERHRASHATATLQLDEVETSVLAKDFDEYEVELDVDGALRASAVHRSASVRGAIEPGVDSLSFEGFFDPEGEPWLIGCGLHIARGARHRLAELVWNSRVLAAREAGLAGTLVGVQYSGWGDRFGGGDEHYLRMCAWGTTRDANLEPYLDAGFFPVGRTDVDSNPVAWLAMLHT